MNFGKDYENFDRLNRVEQKERQKRQNMLDDICRFVAVFFTGAIVAGIFTIWFTSQAF